MNQVLKLIKERAMNKSEPLKRKDGFKLGLAIEGGAMRGIVSAGMVLALEKLNLLNVFDSVYGSSAGAINGAYFLANQADIGTTIYYDDINNKNFINIMNMFSKKPIVSLNFVFHVIRKVKSLNCKAVISSNIPLNVVVSSINKMGSVVINTFDDDDDLLTVLKCSSNIPYFAGGQIEYKGDSMFDAALSQGIPLQAAVDDGCTHVLTLLTRPEGCLEKTQSTFEKLFIEHRLNRIKENLGTIYINRFNDYNKTLKYIETKAHDQSGKPHILPIRLPHTFAKPSNLEKDRNKLIHYAKGGAQAVFDALTGEPHKIMEVISAFNAAGIKI